MDPTKGLGVLIDALRTVPKLRIRLDIYGIAQGASGAAYAKEMRALAADDSRINFLGPLPSQAVVARLREYDFLAVPSQWLETGPMVVLEAFAAGVPVIGWNLGGTAEIVRHGIDGLLISPGPDPAKRWAEVFRLVTESDDLRERLKAGVRPPRGSESVAQDMLTLYDSILS
jgi:glycosyltransferase involved in cell wall biosynthesis